jgi:hypothetical protein
MKCTLCVEDNRMAVVRCWVYRHIVGRDSAVGIGTYCGLDGYWKEPQWWWDISTPVQTDPWGLHRFLYNRYRAFLGVKLPERDVKHPSQSSGLSKERIELNLYSPTGSSWLVLGGTSPWYLHKLQQTTVALYRCYGRGVTNFHYSMNWFSVLSLESKVCYKQFCVT